MMELQTWLLQTASMILAKPVGVVGREDLTWCNRVRSVRLVDNPPKQITQLVAHFYSDISKLVPLRYHPLRPLLETPSAVMGRRFHISSGASVPFS